MRSAIRPESVATLRKRRAVSNLLGLRLEHVLQPLQQDRRLLHLVPEPEQIAIGALASSTSELTATSWPIVSVPFATSNAPTHRNRTNSRNAGDLNRGVVEHHGSSRS